MKTEQWIKQLEDEGKGLKVAFDRSANNILLKKQSLAYQTVRNQTTVVYSGGSYVQDDAERVIVTLDTDAGVNTIAKLEMTCDNPYGRPYVRRLPYVGGARWMVTCASKYPYAPTNILFTVQSMIEGTLSTAELSS